MFRTLLSISILTFSAFAHAAIPTVTASSVSNADLIKKTESGICHPKASAHYARIKHFDSYKTMDECIKSGGKPAKSKG